MMISNNSIDLDANIRLIRGLLLLSSILDLISCMHEAIARFTNNLNFASVKKNNNGWARDELKSVGTINHGHRIFQFKLCINFNLSYIWAPEATRTHYIFFSLNDCRNIADDNFVSFIIADSAFHYY